ncbi:uncharacterized protein LOC128335292 isoform X2 [Hemicordylus capensis]|uniref:uncharacterized protein LOC128335292 isoform X2 n=1 Tax=Hemicordylus capensis TaxID=884348 RepID=UPI00230244A7|nr:uncharacterized protein LOC128335292 isoform X2 [Hemicordylus capensis]
MESERSNVWLLHRGSGCSVCGSLFLQEWVRKHRRVRVDHQRLRKHPSKKTEHRMPGPVYVEQPWLTECLSQGDCYFKCGQWRKEKPAHHMRRPLSVQDLWLALGLGGFLPEHERWLQEFLCGMMRPMLARFMHSLQKRNGGNNPRDGPHPQARVGVLNLPPTPLVPGGPVKWGYRGLNYGDFLWDRAVNQKRIPPLLFTLGGFTLLCITAKAAHRPKKQFARIGARLTHWGDGECH